MLCMVCHCCVLGSNASAEHTVSPAPLIPPVCVDKPRNHRIRGRLGFNQSLKAGEFSSFTNGIEKAAKLGHTAARPPILLMTEEEACSASITAPDEEPTSVQRSRKGKVGWYSTRPTLPAWAGCATRRWSRGRTSPPRSAPGARRPRPPHRADRSRLRTRTSTWVVEPRTQPANESAVKIGRSSGSPR